MPRDGFHCSDVLPSPSDALGIAPFKQRREDAVALWALVPRPVFSMLLWKSDSTLCALGWLAEEKFQGWKWSDRDGPAAPDGRPAYSGAAHFFGLTMAQALACFSAGRSMARFHGRWFARRVTLADVSKSLLALPYYVR